jgi:hypothetical protein
VIFHVDVTQEDIDNGIPAHGTHCPVAIAIERATGGKYVGVAAGITFPNGNGKSVVMPDFVHEWYLAFDYGKHVEPFSFDLKVPDNV